jgi:hypothetical protein
MCATSWLEKFAVGYYDACNADYRIRHRNLSLVKIQLYSKTYRLEDIDDVLVLMVRNLGIAK